MSDHWSTKYLGLPYETGGRTREGLDCWGLVRLVLAEQFEIDLPSFDGAYDSPHDTRIGDLIARHREGWIRTDEPQPGDVAVFRVWGGLNHVGVVTEPGRFLHIRVGRDAVVERLDSSTWRKRIEGIYRYDAAAGTVSIGSLPHPLRSMRLDGEVPAGLSLAEIQEWIYTRTASPLETSRQRAIITVDGFTVPVERWQEFRPLPGQRVEYRAIAEGDNFRQILMVGVLVSALLLAPVIAPFLTFGGAISLSTATSLATAAITGAGSLLVNYLFPTRLKDQKDLDSAKADNMLLGGSNQPNPYGAIPVVLGQMKYTPPLAAGNLVESMGQSSYLRTVLCWGYGPLRVSDIRIGDKALGQFDEVQAATLIGEAGENNTKFNSLYPRDATQLVPNIELIGRAWNQTVQSQPYWRVAFAGRSSAGVVRLRGLDSPDDQAAPHGMSVGMLLLSPFENKWFPIISIVDAYELTCQSDVIGSPITYTNASYGVSATEPNSFVLPAECNNINVAIHFPAGIFSRKVDGTKNVGDVQPAIFRAVVQTRQLDPNTLAPMEAWGNISEKSHQRVFTVPQAYFNTDNDAQLEPVYQWSLVTVDSFSVIRVHHGAYSLSSTANPTGNLLLRQQQANTGFNTSFTLIPQIGTDETELWRICVYGGGVFSVVDKRGVAGFTISGGGLTRSGRVCTLAAATFNRALQSAVAYDNVILKDPFTENVGFEVPTGRWEVRVLRTTDSRPEIDTAVRYYSYAAYVVAITGYINQRPIAPPKPLAMTAVRIRASNQINGNIDGFSGVVTSICPDWDATSSTWIERPTRNPASLFRYVLQHPANAQAVANSSIDLAALQSWHVYCRTNEFMCDMLVLDQRSILDVLRDIAACGRASPALRDGIWTVIVDRPVSTIAQYFTPANSWGFEGSRAFPKLPHAFRVQFNNSERGYQPDEMIVYNDGYTSANATLFEGLSLPGVTTKKAIYKHARFHLAQLKLRPETYTLNVDVEHLICQRGDRVKVTHDVPMWGISAGRIREFVSTTQLTLSEPLEMAAGTQYGIRIRLANGTSITRTVSAKASAGLYTSITLTAAITATEGAAGNLYMVGTLNDETVDCLVLSVEPQENLSARLTLIDYAPAVYDSDTEVIPNFDSNITKPPVLARGTIPDTVTISTIVSNETVMQVLSNGQYGYRIAVTYNMPVGTLPTSIQYVEGQIVRDTAIATKIWKDGGTVPVGRPFYFSDVVQGGIYYMRLRLVTSDGRVGPWVQTVAHTVVGRLTPPPAVTGLAFSVSGPRVLLSWAQGTAIDIIGYEVRTADSGWGTTAPLARISSTQIEVVPAAAGTTGTWYVRAIDSAGLYSSSSASVSLNVSPPGTVPVPTQTINKVGTGTVVLGLDWADATAGTLPVAGYEIRTSNSGWGSSGFLYKGATSAAVLNAISSSVATTLHLKAFDTRGNYSTTACTIVHDVTAPATMSGATVGITRKVSILNMVLSSAPAAPADFAFYEWRIGQVRAGATGGSDSPKAVVSGTTDNFWADPDCTVVQTTTAMASVDVRTMDAPRFSSTGITYRVACRMRDRSGNYSPASALGSLIVTSIT